MGIKSIVNHLNDKGIRARDGGRWDTASLRHILTRETDIGRHRLTTRDHKTRTPQPESEPAIMAVPPIVTEEEFNAANEALRARSPRSTASHTVSGPTLLTGICFCGPSAARPGLSAEPQIVEPMHPGAFVLQVARALETVRPRALPEAPRPAAA